MTMTLTVQLEKPIASAKFMDESTSVPGAKSLDYSEDVQEDNAEHILRNNSENQKKEFSLAYQAINSVITKLNQFYEKIFSEQKEEIAKLSVEIARKVLMQKVEDGDYKIESIVKEALNNAPTKKDIVIHLNPEDIAECQKALQEEPDGELANVKFLSDSNIGRAECQLESPKGIVESLINENLERISKALRKAE